MNKFLIIIIEIIFKDNFIFINNFIIAAVS